MLMQQNRLMFLAAALAGVAALSVSCKEPEPEVVVNPPSLTAFSFKAADNAVLSEAAEGVESETILAVLQKGYKMGDKILRHSMVKVSE